VVLKSLHGGFQPRHGRPVETRAIGHAAYPNLSERGKVVPRRFLSVLSSEALRAYKPDPRIFAALCAETGISPSFDEMKEALGLKSKSGDHRLITGLTALVRITTHNAAVNPVGRTYR
jgi:hypothetical protein